MSCCNGSGVIRLRYHDGSPDEFGICLCATGQDMRSDLNGGKRTGFPLWQVWAYQQQIDPARIGMVEEFLDELELRAMFPDWQPDPAAAPAAAQIADAMRTIKGKL